MHDRNGLNDFFKKSKKNFFELTGVAQLFFEFYNPFF